MIPLNTEDGRKVLDVFHRQGWAEGLMILCAWQLEKLRRELEGARPDDALNIQRIQAEIQIYKKDLPGIAPQLQQYAAERSQAKSSGG